MGAGPNGVRAPRAHQIDAPVLTVRVQLEAVFTLDEADAWRGNQTHNLGCFCALHDRRQRAIELLKEALPMHLTLIEWSEQDGDFDTLRGPPAFQALYPEATG